MVRQVAVVSRMTDPQRNAKTADTLVHGSGSTRGEQETSRETSGEAHAEWPFRVEIAPVIRSKIQPPVLRPSTLKRDRLLQRLHESAASRVTLVVADAGYGKTTLLTDFSVRSGVRTLWYRLDATDADTVTWTNYLVAACREVEPGFGQATLALLGHLPAGGPPKSAFIASFLGELARMAEVPTVLVLDDLHEVEESPEVREIVGRLVSQAPPWLSFIVASRRPPSVEFARLAGMGELAHITTDDLRFSASETEQLFAEGYGLPLETEVLRDLDQRTRGWAASLQLFHGSIRGRPSSAIRALARSLSGAASPIYDFLAEEVLANLGEDLEQFLVRSSLLERVIAGNVVALFADEPTPPTLEATRRWIDEADRLGLLTRTSESSEARQLHPLLRDFLLRQLQQRFSVDEVREMHLRVARAVRRSDPLTACRHFIEAGEQEEAMGCLGASVMLTMGSGQWGVASDLIDRLEGVPADPAVAAIRARRLIEEGDLIGAEQLLLGLEISDSPPDVRAVVRHTKLSLGWRTGDSDLLFGTLRDMQDDAETPPILREIAQIWVDASSMSLSPVALPVLAARLRHMARRQQADGHDFYSAISLHNASIAALNSADYETALRSASEALEAFGRLSFAAPERHSTHSVIALCHLELGNVREAEQEIEIATKHGKEFADVPAELAIAFLARGDRQRGLELIANAEVLQRDGRSDALGVAITQAATAMSRLPTNAAEAVTILSAPGFEGPLDLGHPVARQALLALAHLLAGQPEIAISVARTAIGEARLRRARRAEVRLALIIALAQRETEKIRLAISDAASAGQLGLCEIADALCASLDLLSTVPRELESAIEAHPSRWRPALRRQLERGDVPAGHAAARLLDRFGGFDDVVRLRAYAKTYKPRGLSHRLGIELARRTSPRLRIHDLGKVTIAVDTRAISLSTIRRKPATLLMFLVTRPSFTANREQVLDELWPDADPSSSSNSLNQSLYFLRREIDPWYEDDVATDYVAVEGDLVWLDASLVSADSVDFLAEARRMRAAGSPGEMALDLIGKYSGHFAPEFEYEEWAISWRSRLRSTLLDTAHSAIGACISSNRLDLARDVAIALIDVDPTASDIERRLIWLYWRLGATSAAQAQYEHLARRDEADGVEPTPLAEIVNAHRPH